MQIRNTREDTNFHIVPFALQLFPTSGIQFTQYPFTITAHLLCLCLQTSAAMSVEHIFYYFPYIHSTLSTFSLLCQYVFGDGCCSFFRLVEFFSNRHPFRFFFMVAVGFYYALNFLLCSSHTKRRDIFPHCDKYAMHSTSFYTCQLYNTYLLLTQTIYLQLNLPESTIHCFSSRQAKNVFLEQ